MPIYQLPPESIFPPVSEAEDGLLAVGGDLEPIRIIEAYKHGVFPWYSDDEPILWWSPDPRFVLFPENLKISKSMKTVINSGKFSITMNKDFAQVISNCQKMFRKGQEATWITNEMQEAYIKLHELGIAESVEVWENDVLVGGMYGLRFGDVFCGESMFAKVSNASKLAFIWFVQKFEREGGKLIDCQVPTTHLGSLGAEEIKRENFIELINNWM